jgi:hypothetical protein
MFHWPPASAVFNLLNCAVKHSVKIARERFISSIDPLTVRRLASSYNGGEPCDIFEELIAGSYNICYPVAFSTQGSAQLKRWIARIPLPPCVAFIDEKMGSEIATLRYKGCQLHRQLR